MEKSSPFKNLVGKKLTRVYKFMGEDIKISKLSVSQVMEIQEDASKAQGDNSSGFDLLKKVIRMSVEDTEDTTDEDFNTFPMDELSKLSNEIMKFSGIDQEKGK